MNGYMNNFTLQYTNSATVLALENAERTNARRLELLEQQSLADKKRNALNAFIPEAKKFLLSESMFYVLKKCLPSNIDESFLSYGRAITESFVQEESVDNLLRRFKTKTLFLSELADIIESTHKQVIHGAEEKEPPYKVSKSKLKVFHDKLENLDSDSITQEISSRVMQAEENFIASNIKDKEKIEDLATKTQDKMEKIKDKTKDEDTRENIKQEYAALYRKNVDNTMQRKKGILESIVTRMSEQIVTEDTMRAKFTKESGKLDMQRIIETAEVMYTFLEMVNTTKIKELDATYLSSVLDSIK